MDIIQDIWEDYKKPIMIILAVILVFIVGLIIFSAVYNPIKITFTGEDAEVIATMSNEIKLGAKATNKSGEEFEVEWEVSDGTLSSTKANDIIWELPKKEGTYTISVKAGEKIVKNKTLKISYNKLYKNILLFFYKFFEHNPQNNKNNKKSITKTGKINKNLITNDNKNMITKISSLKIVLLNVYLIKFTFN